MAISIAASALPAPSLTGSYVFTVASALGRTPTPGHLVVIAFSTLDTAHGASDPTGHWTKDRTALNGSGEMVTIFSRVFDGTENASYTFGWTSTTARGIAVWEVDAGFTGGRWFADTGVSTTVGNPFPVTIGTTATLSSARSIAFVAGGTATNVTGWGISGGGTWTRINNDPGLYVFGSLVCSATTALTPVLSKTSGATFISDAACQTYACVPPVGQDLTLLSDIHGPVGKDLTLLANIYRQVGPFAVRCEVAWATAPLTRPSGGAWSPLSAVSKGLRKLNIKRGTKVRSYALETGTASVQADNKDRKLDPSNTASPVYPNVKPRKRIRFIVNVGGIDYPLFTGFTERWPIEWKLDTGWVTITAQDLFGLLANAILPPSVLDVVYRGLAPVAYWPMSEVNNTQADDVVGTLDGTYAYPVQTTGDLVPFDPRKAPKFGRPTNSTTAVPPNMTVTPFVANPAVSGSVWFKWDVPTLVPGLTRRETVFMLQDSTVPVTFTGSTGIKSVFFFPGFNDTTGEQKVGLVIRDGSGFNQIDSPITPWLINIYDGQAHHLAFSIDGATKTRHVWVDGVPQVMHDNPDPSVSPISAIDVAGVLSAVRLAAVGWGIQWNSPSQNQDSAAVGQAAYFDRVLTDPEVLSIYQAGTAPWSGDTTGARANRILDLLGIDPLDRDIDTGTQVCGPTNLNSQNGLAYLRKINATEGGVCFVSGDGKVTLRARNDSPTIGQKFSDKPSVDGGVPYRSIKPDFSYDRIINTLVVGRENGADQIITNPASITAYGPLSGATGGKIDTLAATADDARTTGTRLVTNHGDPATFVPALVVPASDRGVTVNAVTGVEIGTAVELFARPAGGGAAIDLPSLVEGVNHDFPATGEWNVTYSITEY